MRVLRRAEHACLFHSMDSEARLSKELHKPRLILSDIRMKGENSEYSGSQKTLESIIALQQKITNRVPLTEDELKDLNQIAKPLMKIIWFRVFS